VYSFIADAIARIGDMIGCRILYEEKKDQTLPVSFTRNGRVIGTAMLNIKDGKDFYPYVGIASEATTLLFRVSKLS
jgi:hypothetical protein